MTGRLKGIDRDELYVVARRVLLDALAALADQRDAVILVGAQAVYLRSHAAELAVAAFTSDADLGLDPSLLEDEPRLEAAMCGAGFKVNQPGQWTRPERVGERVADIAVDLLVPESLSGADGRRGARIPPHAKTAARKVRGLEAAIVDHDPLDVASLQPTLDDRVVNVKVAGVAALLIAKSYKIGERLAESGASRALNKDAGDVVRLMMTSDIGEVAGHFAMLMDHDGVGSVAREGLRGLRRQFGASSSPGTQMAVAALAGAMPEATVRALSVAYLAQLPMT